MGQVLVICKQIPEIVKETKPKYDPNLDILSGHIISLIDSFSETFVLVDQKFKQIQLFSVMQSNFRDLDAFKVYLELMSILLNYCKSITQFGILVLYFLISSASCKKPYLP